MARLLKPLGLGVGIGILVLVFATPGNVLAIRWLEGNYSIQRLGGYALGLGLACFVLLHFWMGSPSRLYNPVPLIFLFAGVWLIVWALPALAIYWIVHPERPKRALQVASLLLAAGIAIVYYVRNKDEFPKPDQKVTFFSGVILTPPGVLEFLL